MAVRDTLLTLLENNRDRYLSGEEVAASLHVTRAAVWKAVKALEEDGYLIDATQNRGYKLQADCDLLSAAGIKKFLRQDAGDLSVEAFQTVTSTNNLLRDRAVSGAHEGLIVVAGTQTDGRGRLGRSFYSPSSTGIYMSILLRPTLPAERAVLMTTAAAVAVCEAIESVLGKTPGIKWVNDVFLDGRKVCGILTEAAFDTENGRLRYAIVGIGVNVYAPEGGFPEPLAAVAGCVTDTREGELRNKLAAEILNRFLPRYYALPGGSSAEDYRRRCFVIGQRVTVHAGDTAYSATVLGVDDDCRLLVRRDDGREVTLSSGEISIRLGED
ncbi:MAG: biotin--[acetyl-CoA-carboxylase] ligase [Clostridiaceae bacterium]|nr:biotin--[acetyl-CoA-carboxylase] ligase [Clostridiaceae bacterium]